MKLLRLNWPRLIKKHYFRALAVGMLAALATISPLHAQTPPTISAITGTGVDGSGNLIMNEDGDITVNFTVSDAETAGGSLTVNGTRSNTTLFTSIGTNSSSRLRLAVVNEGERSLRVRPAANLSGTSSVTYTLSGTPGIATVEVSLMDDATAGGPARTNAVQTFTIGSYSSVERTVVARVHTDAISTFLDSGVVVLATKTDINGQFGVRLAPAYVWFHSDDASATTVPAGAEFIAPQGAQVWIAPEANPGSSQLWPGFSTESVPVGAIDNDQTTFAVVGFNGPGHLELFTLGAFGEVNRLWSTDEGITNFTVTGQTHMHANWAFTAAGKYEITVEARFAVSGQPGTARATYTFFVGNTLPVAQPTQITLSSSTSGTVLGTPVTLNAAITPSAAAGWVEFLNGTNLLGRRPVANAAASLLVTDFSLGNHVITAHFVPFEVNYFSPATSAPVTIPISTEWGGLLASGRARVFINRVKSLTWKLWVSHRRMGRHLCGASGRRIELVLMPRFPPEAHLIRIVYII